MQLQVLVGCQHLSFAKRCYADAGQVFCRLLASCLCCPIHALHDLRLQACTYRQQACYKLLWPAQLRPFGMLLLAEQSHTLLTVVT